MVHPAQFRPEKYSWNANPRLAVFKNFEYLATYDTCPIAHENDGCTVARYHLYHYIKLLTNPIFQFNLEENAEVKIKSRVKKGFDLNMEWDGCMSSLQRYLENNPLVVLGSGASISYGLPSMTDLAKKIKKSAIVSSDPSYVAFCAAVDNSGLEAAIDSATLQSETIEEIRRVVWETVNKKDILYFDQHHIEPPKSLVDLLKKVIAPTPNEAVIVTTNYDRLAEYAADGVGATTVTGFEGAFVKRFELSSDTVKKRRICARERIVNIWKVHGSLDWFIASDGTIAAFPLTRTIPHDFQPLIVPPGKDKYSITHDEPYRTVIAEADKAFECAGAYLCVGYGFNDEHIQPKLLAQISKGKPIVILARDITPACRKLIIDAKISKYLIFECSDSTHTKVYGNGWEEIYEGQYWLLDHFMEIW